MSLRKRDSALGAVVTLLGAGISARWAFGAMPKAHARPAGRRGADRSQVRLDGFLSPRGGVTRPHRASVGTPSSGSAFVRCPACGADVAMRLLNDHLDSEKCASVSTARGDERRDERRRDGDGDGDKSRVAGTASAHLSSGDPTNADARRTNATDAWTALMRHDARRYEKQKTLTERASVGKDPLRLHGHFVIEDFVTVAEEMALVAFLDDEKRSGARWRLSGFNGKHLGKKWGVEVDLKRRTVKTEGVRPMPPELLAVAARLRDLAASELDTSSDASFSDDVERVSRTNTKKKMPRAVASAVAGFAPNEANAIDYRRASGMELLPHCDDRQMSSGVLVNLSLLGDCVMTYARDAKRKQKAVPDDVKLRKRREDENENDARSEGDAVDVFLPRRSLQVQTGETRYEFSHAIRNENLLAARRVSVTFRESATPAARRKAHEY